MTVTPQATFVATLVDEWARAGVTDAVIAPGSRSTPLALALARDDRIRVHVHLDERAAGFFALGIGLATGRPAVVLTTSGTAAVELHPAVVESSQARVPLIACTADRPPELHHVAAPQTVEQAHLYGNVVRWFVEPGVADGSDPSTWRSLAARTVVEAVAGAAGPGPVHVNVAFRDPLVGDPGELPGGRTDGRLWHDASPPVPSAADDPGLAGRRGIVVAGWGTPVAETFELAQRLHWPVFADPRSRCRATTSSIAAFDSILRVDDWVGSHVPEVVLRVGAPPASKVLSQWLASLPDDVDQYVVDQHGGWPDPERRATGRLRAVPAVEVQDWSDAIWLAHWMTAEDAAQRAIDDVLSRCGDATEPGTLRALTRDLPPETVLFVSSSMPVRDVEWFGSPRSTHRVLSNRGANGIDGVVATALGVAAADPSTPVAAVVGDLAFLYDSSALLWAARRDVDLTIVVIDNAGGGIFSFLPQRDVVYAPTFEQLFTTPHDVDIPALAAVHGIPSVDRVGEGTGLRLVHVRTDRDANVRLHALLHDAVADAVRATGICG